MNEIQKIVKSRETLKEILDNEWDVSSIAVYSESEIEELYSYDLSKNSPLNTMGIAAPCSFEVSHKQIPSYKLHVLYYNFPELGKTSSKVTKSIIDRINNLYADEVFQSDDSLMIIINDSVTETIQAIVDKLNFQLKEDYSISKKVMDEMKNSSIQLQEKHFKNVFIFDIRMFVTNLMKHEMLPTYIPIRDESEISSILKKCNAQKHQMPIISRTDNIGKMLRLVPGDLCKLIRKSSTCGNYIYYRICK